MTPEQRQKFMDDAVRLLGIRRVARICRVTFPRVLEWQERGSAPNWVILELNAALPEARRRAKRSLARDIAKLIG